MTQLETYIHKLKMHDWNYMYADSLREFNRGKGEWLEISALQRKVDPEYKIFNEHAPKGMRIDPSTLPGAAK